MFYVCFARVHVLRVFCASPMSMFYARQEAPRPCVSHGVRDRDPLPLSMATTPKAVTTKLLLKQAMCYRDGSRVIWLTYR